jgi:protein tyrosine phosphatase
MQRTRLAEGMLANDLSHPWALEADPKVKERNRYFNVQAWANCRIHLRVADGECDFINASPIRLEDSVTRERRQYIATQVGCAVRDSRFIISLTMTRARNSDILQNFGTWSSMKVKKSALL